MLCKFFALFFVKILTYTKIKRAFLMLIIVKICKKYAFFVKFLSLVFCYFFTFSVGVLLVFSYFFSFTLLGVLLFQYSPLVGVLSLKQHILTFSVNNRATQWLGYLIFYTTPLFLHKIF